MIHETSSLKVDGNLLADIHTILTNIHTSSLRDCAVWVENIDNLEIMCLTEIIVVHVMCRSYLQTTCTELDINISVLDYRNHTVYQRNNYLMTTQPMVLWVLRVDTHSSITHDCLRTCGSYNCIVALLILMENLTFLTCENNRVLRCISYIVLEVIEL